MRAALCLAALVAAVLPGCLGSGQPSLVEVEDRLNGFDADGAGGPYRMSLGFNWLGQTQSMDVIVDPKGKVILLEGPGAAEYILPDGRRIVIVDDQAYEGRGQDGGPLAWSSDLFDVASLESGTYKGTMLGEVPFPVAVGQGAFELRLDTKGRFQQLALPSSGLGAIAVGFSYDVAAPHPPEDAVRLPARIRELPAENQAAGVVHRVDLDPGSEDVPPDELEARFVDASGTIVASTRFDEPLNGTHVFRWRDSGHRGVVDSFDSYEFAFPPSTSRMRVWDSWAGRYSDEALAGIEVETPGLGLPMLAALLLGATWGRQRR